MDTRLLPAFFPSASILRGGTGLLMGLLGLGALGGCSGFSSDAQPIPDSTFTRILTELHLAEARDNLDEAAYPRALRDSIFARYGVQPADFDATLDYYSRRPEAFEALYQPVIDSLEALQGVRTSLPHRPDSVSPGKRQYMPNP